MWSGGRVAPGLLPSWPGLHISIFLNVFCDHNPIPHPYPPPQANRIESKRRKTRCAARRPVPRARLTSIFDFDFFVQVCDFTVSLATVFLFLFIYFVLVWSKITSREAENAVCMLKTAIYWILRKSHTRITVQFIESSNPTIRCDC